MGCTSLTAKGSRQILEKTIEGLKQIETNHWENDEKLVQRQEFEWKFHPGSVGHCCSIFGPELMTYLKKQCT